MEKLLTGEAGYILLFAGVLLAGIAGVVSILLPILVFKVLSEVSDMNRKLGRILTLLSEGARENSGSGPLNHGPEEKVRLGPSFSQRGDQQDMGKKSLRFQ